MRAVRRSGGHRQAPRRGAAAAELAVALPLLLLLALGCVDFGRFAYTYIAVTNAARAGAGYGSANTFAAADYSTWQANAKQAAADEISQLSGFNAGNLTVTATADSTGETSGLWRATVTVTYPFQTVFTWPGIPANVAVTRTVALRNIR